MGRANVNLSHTIFAVASGSLPSAVAILKISGSESFSTIRKLFSSELPYQRGMHRGVLHDFDESKIDEVLLLSFIAPESHTGEDVIEIHCHGSIPIVRKIEKVLVQRGLRPAEKGEFSYRAILNQKLSTREIEDLGDVFLARDENDLRRIYERKNEALEVAVQHLRDGVIRMQAILDTAVDFTEEYSHVVTEAQGQLSTLIHECSVVTQGYHRFCNQSARPRLVLAGEPNAGKSSLFNAVLSRYRAIVDAQPGTTRDVIEEDIEASGTIWKLVDTAGFREAEGLVESQGISLGSDFLAASQIWVLVVDGTRGFGQNDLTLLKRYAHIPHLIAWNKRDDPQWLVPSDSQEFVRVSCKTGEGVGDLIRSFSQLSHQIERESSTLLPTATEYVRLCAVREQLGKLKAALELSTAPEYLAEINRSISAQLERVVGEITTDDVLGRVFSEFCIGK